MYCVPYRYCVSFSFVKAICGHWSAYLKTYIYSIYVHCTAGAGQNDVIDHLLFPETGTYCVFLFSSAQYPCVLYYLFFPL